MESRIVCYHIWYLICLAACLICLTVSAGIFFKLKIYKVIRYFVGRKWMVIILLLLAALGAEGFQVHAEGKEPLFDNGIQNDECTPRLISCIAEGEQVAEYSGKPLFANRPEADAAVTIQIREDARDWEAGRVRIEVVNLETGQCVWKKMGGDLNWDYDDTCYGTVFEFDGEPFTEAAYQVRVSYEDLVGNTLEMEEGLKDTFILDHKAPEMEVAFSEAVCATDQAYYNETISGTVVITDLYGTPERREDGTITDISGFTFLVKKDGETRSDIEVLWSEKEEDGTFEGSFEILGEENEADGNYEVFLQYHDLAGNAVEEESPVLVLDTTPPQCTWSAQVSESTFLDSIRYGDMKFWFAKQKMTVRVRGEDSVSGIRKLLLEITDEEGKVQSILVDANGEAVLEREIQVPLEGENFIGSVRVEIRDTCQHLTEECRTCVVESEAKHRDTGTLEITTLTAPSRTVDGVDYYGGDVRLGLLFRDEYSGLASYRYQVGSQGAVSRDLTEEAQEILYEEQQELTIFAASDNRNDVVVRAEFTDHAGHTSEAEKRYHIDVTVPEIAVTYDCTDSMEERYYNTPRVATVAIRERNFDPRDVEFLLTNSYGPLPSIGEWTTAGSGDDTLHTCQIVFEADGDYSFSVAFQDLAGNQAEYSRVDRFVIDRTVPEVRVIYEGCEPRNGYYYRQARTAVLEIREKNFEEEQIEVLVSDSAQEQRENPQRFAWTSEGDVHRMRIAFEQDGTYTLAVIGQDRAGNQMASYGPDLFVVDRTAPELKITGVKDRSSNRGDVNPLVFWSDENLDKTGIKLSFRGARNGNVKAAQPEVGSKEGMWLPTALEHIPEADDLYEMEAEITDLAGNSSVQKIRFSVNRFGSSYEFAEMTRALLGENGSFYTKEEPELAIREINVDPLEMKEVILNRNGSLQVLKEGVDYTVTASETEEMWNQYDYRIHKSNFEEEGIYRITINSRDRAKNVSNNNQKGMEMEFALDKTPPSVILAGVEHLGQYRERRRSILLDVQDNLCLEGVTVCVDGKLFTYSGEELERLDGRIPLVLEQADHWQSLWVSAVDAVGNEQKTDTIRFLITPNLLVQAMQKKMFLYGGAVGSMLFLTGSVWLYRRRRRGR